MKTGQTDPSSPGTGTSVKGIVYVVDDDEAFRTGIMRVLRAAGYVAHGFASAGDFLVALRTEPKACVLLDVRMPGPSGFELQEALGRMGAYLPVIFLSGQGSIPETVRAMKAGALDFLTKPVKTELLLDAIENALRRGMEARAEWEEVRVARARYQTLTPREREVFGRVIAGKMNKEVADELGTTERTVKAQRASLMAKMKVNSFADLVRIGFRLQPAPTVRDGENPPPDL